MPAKTKPAATLTPSKPAKGKMALLVGTRKGAFMLRGDKTRRKWKMSEGLFIGHTIHDMMLDPRDGRTMLMTSRSGHLGPTIFRSTDYGETWQEAKQPPAFAQAPEGQKGRVVNHTFWLAPGHASEPGVWYAGTSPQGLFRSDDGGATWQEVTGFNNHPMREVWGGPDEEGPPDGARLHSILIDPRDPNHMYISLSSGGFFESTDRGAHWQPLCRGLLSDFLPVQDAEYGHDPHCTRLHLLMPDRIYSQTHCGVYRMDRGDDQWVRIGTNLPEGITDHGFPIVLHPRDPDTVWVFPNEAFPYARVPHDGKPATFVTHDGGETWKRQDKGMPKTHGWFTIKRQGMAADEHDPVGLYFGTTGGEIWASLDEGASWSQIFSHLPEIYSVEVAEF